MLFLVLSSPKPERPNDVKDARLKFWPWMDDLKERKKVTFSNPRIGRGFVAVFDVTSNDELHQILTEWSNIIPAHFDLYPLATPSEAERLLK